MINEVDILKVLPVVINGNECSYYHGNSFRIKYNNVNYQVYGETEQSAKDRLRYELLKRNIFYERGCELL